MKIESKRITKLVGFRVVGTLVTSADLVNLMLTNHVFRQIAKQILQSLRTKLSDAPRREL